MLRVANHIKGSRCSLCHLLNTRSILYPEWQVLRSGCRYVRGSDMSAGQCHRRVLQMRASFRANPSHISRNEASDILINHFTISMPVEISLITWSDSLFRQKYIQGHSYSQQYKTAVRCLDCLAKIYSKSLYQHRIESNSRFERKSQPAWTILWHRPISWGKSWSFEMASNCSLRAVWTSLVLYTSQIVLNLVIEMSSDFLEV